MRIYIVKKGDTLYEIAQKYGVEIEDILAANPLIDNPDELKVGLKVKIPKKPTQVLAYDHKGDAKSGLGSYELETEKDLFKQYNIPAEKVGSFYDLPELGEMNHQTPMIEEAEAYAQSLSTSQSYAHYPHMLVSQQQLYPYAQGQHPLMPSFYPPVPYSLAPAQHPYSPVQHDLGVDIKPMLAEPLSTEPLKSWQQLDCRTEEVDEPVESSFIDREDFDMQDDVKKRKSSQQKSGSKQQALRGSKVKRARKKTTQRSSLKANTPWQP